MEQILNQIAFAHNVVNQNVTIVQVQVHLVYINLANHVLIMVLDPQLDLDLNLNLNPKCNLAPAGIINDLDGKARGRIL